MKHQAVCVRVCVYVCRERYRRECLCYTDDGLPHLFARTTIGRDWYLESHGSRHRTFFVSVSRGQATAISILLGFTTG